MSRQNMLTLLPLLLLQQLHRLLPRLFHILQQLNSLENQKEEVAAIRIQTAFCGYQARRALRGLRGLVRLKSLVDGPTIKHQTAYTLKCMQTVSRVKSQIQFRRIRMSEENWARQRQLLQKHAKEI